VGCDSKTSTDSHITDDYLFMDASGQMVIKYYENNRLKNITSVNAKGDMHGYQTSLNDSNIEQTFYYEGKICFTRKMFKHQIHYYNLSEDSSDTLFIGRRVYDDAGKVIKDNLILNRVPFVWKLEEEITFHFKEISPDGFIYIGPVNNELDFDKNKLIHLNEHSMNIASSITGLELISGIYHREKMVSGKRIMEEIIFYSPFYGEDSSLTLNKEFVGDITYWLYLNW